MTKANEVRRGCIAALIAACRVGATSAAMDTAYAAVCVRAKRYDDPGFSMNDLVYHRDRLLDKADAMETDANRLIGTVNYLTRKVKGAEEKAERLTAKMRRVGGTMSRTEFVSVRADAEQAAQDVIAMRDKIAGITARVVGMQSEVDAITEAAEAVQSVIDSRTTHVVQSIKTVTTVAVA